MPASFPTPEAARMATVRALRSGKFETSDRALVAAIRQGHPAGAALLYDRYHAPIRRVLMRVLGPDQELYDLLHEVFARALADIHALERSERLGPWLTSIAIYTARGHIRRRQRHRWLSFFAPSDLPEPPVDEPDEDARRAARSTYALLQRMPADERVAFSLRYIEGMNLAEIADACAVSVATAKRRLARSEERFGRLARKDPALRGWLAAAEGER